MYLPSHSLHQMEFYIKLVLIIYSLNVLSSVSTFHQPREKTNRYNNKHFLVLFLNVFVNKYMYLNLGCSLGVGCGDVTEMLCYIIPCIKIKK